MIYWRFGFSSGRRVRGFRFIGWRFGRKGRGGGSAVARTLWRDKEGRKGKARPWQIADGRWQMEEEKEEEEEEDQQARGQCRRPPRRRWQITARCWWWIEGMDRIESCTSPAGPTGSSSSST